MAEEFVQSRSEALSPVRLLSARERQVLRLIDEGRPNAEMAAALGLSIKTIETYRSRLMRKLDVKDVPKLVKCAISWGIKILE